MSVDPHKRVLIAENSLIGHLVAKSNYHRSNKVDRPRKSMQKVDFSQLSIRVSAAIGVQWNSLQEHPASDATGIKHNFDVITDSNILTWLDSKPTGKWILMSDFNSVNKKAPISRWSVWFENYDDKLLFDLKWC